jgi:hypothetical protein
MRKTLIATAGALVAVLIAAGVAAASKPSSSLSLVVVNSGTGASSVQPSYAGQVTFNVATTQTDQPYVNLRCYQGSAFVYDDWGYFGGGQQKYFTLSSGYWTGGAASCTARLVAFDKQGRQQTLASMTFSVSA